MTRLTLRLAEPLPECLQCEQPVKRETHQRTGGLCSLCAADVVQLHVRRTSRG